MKILYVEDNPNDADLAQRWLRKHAPQFAIDVVTTLSDAVARLSGPDAPPFDLVLTDLRLPDGGGLSLLTYVRECGLPIAVVVITGTGDEKTAVTALKAGADDYVSKRDDYLERLPLTLENALRRRRAQDARQSRPLKALYAERHDTDIDLTLRHLQRYAPHIQLEVVRTGAEALLRLPRAGDASMYDVILLDYRLPGLNALEVLKELRQDRGQDIPVVFVTGQGDEEVALQALKLGAESYLVKNPGYLHQLPGELENACYRAEIIRKQEALRQSEERLRLAQRAARVGTWDWNLVTGETNWSEGVYELLGHAQGDGSASVEDFAGSIHPEDRERAKDKVESVIKYGEEHHDEFRIIRPDGAIAWLESKGRVIRGASGRAERMIGVNIDITDRKRAEERLRSYFELPLIGMAITSPDRRFVEVNQKLCDILGYSMDQLTGMSWVDVTHPDDVAENIRLLDQTLKGETEGYVMDKRFIHRDGRIVYASISARCVRRADRTVDYLALVIQDITETKRAELNTQFINQLDFEMSQITDADEIIRLATNRLGEYLGVASCYVIEANPAAGLAFVRESWDGWRSAGPSKVGKHRISDFVTPECLDEFEAGRATVVKDVMNDPRTRDFASKYKSLGVGAFISIPALNERQWEANLTVDHPKAREWRPDETQLIRDIAARLWPAYKRARATEALREGEERLRLALEAGRMGVWEWDVRTNAVKWSRENFTIMGLDPFSVEPDYHTWADRVSPDDLPAAQGEIDRAIAEKGEFRYEYRVIWPDGSVRWVEDRGKPIYDEGGQCLKVSGLIVDITERKQAEDALRQSEARYRAIVEDQTELVCRLLPDGKYTFVNEAYCRYFGRSSEELISGDFLPFIPAEEVERINQFLAEITPSNPVATIEHRVVLPDGEARWHQWTDRGIFDEQGRLLEFQCVGRDVTQRKHAEEALRLSEDKFSKAFRSSPDAFAISSQADGKILEVNERWAEILGYTRDEAVGRTAWELQIYLDPGERERLISLLKEHGSARDFEVDIRKKSGEIRNALISAEPITIRDEPCMILIVRDITQRKQMERALVQSQRRYSLASTAGRVGVWDWNLETNDIYVDPELKAWLGYRDDEIRNHLDDWGSHVHPEDAEAVMGAAQDHIEGRAAVFEVEHRMIRKDGEIFWLLARGNLIEDENGARHIFGTDTDITERKRAGEALSQSEERLRLALEAGRMGVWEWDTRTNSIKWSKEHFTIMGLAPFGVEPDYHTWAERVYPDDLPVAMGAIRKAIEEKGVYRCEYRIIWPDGNLRWVEGRGKPVYDEGGQCLKVSGLIVDITERKRAGEALRESEERLQIFIEHAPASLAMFDREMRYLAVSRRWMTDYHLGDRDIRGQSHYAIFPEIPEHWKAAHRRTLEGEVLRADEDRFVRADGEVQWLRWETHPWHAADGPIGGIVIFTEDISERKLAEEALRASHARIEDLAGRLIAAQEEERRHIARELHDDLNQQVAALAIGISRLKRQLPDDDAVQEQIARLREKTDWLSERIRQVSHELHSSILQHVGLPAALNSYCVEFSEREGIAVTLDIQDGVDAVSPDAALCLYRVAQESLRNIARHSGARSAVVALAGVNGAIELRIADRGVGFDPGLAREGRGLGLVSMEERVKLLHGNFVLTTQTGEGTELRAQIPLRGKHEQNDGPAC